MVKSCKKKYSKWQRHEDVKFFVKMEQVSFRNHLNLPRKYTRNFKGKIYDTVKLRGPSGRVWQIKVLNSENRLSLKSGRRNFVTANKVDVDDLLVFKYTGNSSFDVFIFEPSGCEKVDFVTINYKRIKTETESEVEKTSSESETSVRICIPPEWPSADNQVSPCGIRVKKFKASYGDGESSHTKKLNKHVLSDKPYLLPRNLKLSDAQEKIADEMAIPAQSGSKLFVKIMSAKDIHHYLTIPKCFAIEMIGSTSQPINLQLANKQMIFPCRYVYDGRRSYITSGWKDFVHKYKLKERSLCLFEVRKLGAKFTMVIHVNRVGN